MLRPANSLLILSKKADTRISTSGVLLQLKKIFKNQDNFHLQEIYTNISHLSLAAGVQMGTSASRMPLAIHVVSQIPFLVTCYLYIFLASWEVGR